VAQHYQVTEGGLAPPPDHFRLETSDEFEPSQLEDALDNIRINVKRDLPVLKLESAEYAREGKSLLICAGGPTLKDHIEEIKRADGCVFAINDTYDYLVEQGIVPWGFGMMEIAPWPHDFLKHANKDTKYFLASMAHPTAFDRLEGFDVTMWHAWAGIGEDAIIGPGVYKVTGGEALSIRAINLGLMLGFREFEMYGVDGCFAEETHAYYDRDDIQEGTQEVWFGGRLFKSHYYLARQAKDLARLCKIHHHLFKLKTHGDGLVQYSHRTMFPEQYEEQING